jgi:hypothetical protein
MIGEKCIVREYRTTRMVGACDGDRANHGWIEWMAGSNVHAPRVEVNVAPAYEQRENLRGRRPNCIKVVEAGGSPIPEVALLMAVLNESVGERFFALPAFIRERREMADTILPNVETVAPEGIVPDADVERDADFGHPLSSLVSEPILFRRFVGEFMLQKFISGEIDELAAWQTAALRAISKRKEIRDETMTTCFYTRILAAIKQAALECGGVPNQVLIRKKLAVEGNPVIPKATCDSIMATLGFSWIPGKPDWTKHWKPHLEKKRGGDVPDLS